VSETSHRTIARDAIVTCLEQLKAGGAARVKEFAVSLRYLTEQETSGKTTYCVVITDESGNPQTLERDSWDMTALIVLYAYDTRDPRARLDAAIEDVSEAVLQLAATLKDAIWKLKLTEITTDEGTTAAGPWAQAVTRWSLSHRRRAMAA
jgi:hypothetical protein